ncbi:MAG TPA: transketolase C-terminal domain-containing protein, partial [Sphingomicrobium sp.]
PWAKHPGSVVPEGYYSIPLGKARTVREGEAMTVLAYGTMIHVAEAMLAEKGVDAEIIDLRTLVPIDIEAVEKSVQKTGRCLVIHEATRTSGFGAELTVLAYGTMIHVAEAVLREKGVDAEIIDLRTLVPIDIETVQKSVEKTGKCLIVHEATRTSGFGAELSALVQERCFYHLEAPIERVTGFDTPYPHSLEWAYFPGPIRIGEAVDRLLGAG